MTALDLFSGIGGFTVAGRRVWGAEHRVEAFCEVDPYCQVVLRRHWPDTPIISDIHDLDGHTYRGIDLITGGFPCQDISAAGKRIGIDGTRSGLWREMRRVIEEARPRWVVIENSDRLRTGGLDRVLHSLAELGYDAEWHRITAAEVGAPHIRRRMWIVAWDAANADRQALRLESGWCSRALREMALFVAGDGTQGDAAGWTWGAESPVPGVDDGIPDRSHRWRVAGNAIVPEVARRIFAAIKSVDQ